MIGSPKSEAGHRTIPMAPPVLNALREWKLACPRIDATEAATPWPALAGVSERFGKAGEPHEHHQSGL